MPKPIEYRLAWSIPSEGRILARRDTGSGSEDIEIDGADFFEPMSPLGEHGIGRALVQFFLLGEFPNFARDAFETAVKTRPFRVGSRILSLHPEGIRKNTDGTFDAAIYHEGGTWTVRINPEEIAAYEPSMTRAFANARTWAQQAGFTVIVERLVEALNARTFWG